MNFKKRKCRRRNKTRGCISLFFPSMLLVLFLGVAVWLHMCLGKWRESGPWVLFGFGSALGVALASFKAGRRSCRTGIHACQDRKTAGAYSSGSVTPACRNRERTRRGKPAGIRAQAGAITWQRLLRRPRKAARNAGWIYGSGISKPVAIKEEAQRRRGKTHRFDSIRFYALYGMRRRRFTFACISTYS